MVIPTVIAGIPSTTTSAYILKRETDSVLPIWHGIPPEFVRIEARYEEDTVQLNGSTRNPNDLPESHIDRVENHSSTEAPPLNSILSEASYDSFHLRGPTPLLYAGILFSTFGVVVLGISVLQYRRPYTQYVITKV